MNDYKLSILLFVLCFAILFYVRGGNQAENDPVPDGIQKSEGSVTVIMGAADDACYRGEVQIVNDGKDGRKILVIIHADRKDLLADQF